MSEQIKRLTQAIRDNESELSYGTIRTLAMIDAESEKSNARPALPDDIQRMIEDVNNCDANNFSKGGFGIPKCDKCILIGYDKNNCTRNTIIDRLIEYIKASR